MALKSLEQFYLTIYEPQYSYDSLQGMNTISIDHARIKNDYIDFFTEDEIVMSYYDIEAETLLAEINKEY